MVSRSCVCKELSFSEDSMALAIFFILKILPFPISGDYFSKCLIPHTLSTLLLASAEFPSARVQRDEIGDNYSRALKRSYFNSKNTVGIKKKENRVDNKTAVAASSGLIFSVLANATVLAAWGTRPIKISIEWTLSPYNPSTA